MKTEFRYRVLTIIVFCAYIILGSFSGDLTQSHNSTEGFPYHRIVMLLTAFIFIFNAQQVLIACQKNKVLITLLLYLLLTALWANNPMETLKIFIFLISVLFISIMISLSFLENKVILIRALFWLFFLLTLASVITALFFPKIGIQTGPDGVKRWQGITNHANALGIQALITIWISSNLFFLSKNKIEKFIILFAISLAFYLLTNANSMTSLITSLVVTSYVCYCYKLGQLKLPIKLFLFSVVLFGLIIIITFYTSTSELATTTMQSTGRNLTFTGRTVLWQTALKYATDNLTFGYGFDSLEQLTRKTHLQMSHLHNGYIEVLFRGGVIASILLAFILIKTLYHQLKIKLAYKYDFIFLNTGLVMVLMHNFTESSFLKGLSLLSIFIIYIIVSTSLIPIANKDKSSVAQ